jgi:K+-transporting ATPase ATPase C chain
MNRNGASNMFNVIRPAISLVVLLTLITGIAYPLVVTGVAQVAFADQANGSLMYDETGRAADGDEWFHPRPSAGAFATVASAASNLAPSNPALATRIKEQAARLFVVGQGPVPLALLTTSGSGLDPHLPPAAVAYQVARVATARHVSVQLLQGMIVAHTQASLIGPPVVNVLALNTALQHLPTVP